MLPLAMPRPRQAVTSALPPSPLSLSLDFVSQQYRWNPDGNGLVAADTASLLTVNRASTANVIDANGQLVNVPANQPRLDHDPLTGTCQGLLVEASAENLLSYSAQFDNASWTKSGVSVTADTAPAPDGNNSADKLIESNGGAAHQLWGIVPFTSGQTYCFSVYAKAGERQTLQLLLNTAAFPDSANAYFDLSSGTVLYTGAGLFSAGITPAGAGWYRLYIVATADTTISTAASIRLMQDANTLGYAGDGSSGLYAWGAQVETGSGPTSYIATASTTATRAPDVITMPLDMWFNGDAGTVRVTFDSSFQASGIARRGIFALTSDADNRLVLDLDQTGTLHWTCQTAASLQADISIGTHAQDTVSRIAAVYTTNDVAAAANGAPVVQDTDALLPGMTMLTLGASDMTKQLNGHIRAFDYWNQRLTDASLRQLSA